MSSNRINTHFTAEQREEARATLVALAASLPFLIDLSPEERAAMPRFGDKSRGFISKALDIAENNPDRAESQRRQGLACVHNSP